MLMKQFLSHLNAEQYNAATHINGPMLIIAGAGSGKTLTLVSRVSNMISEGIDPKSILLLTFTNKAAKEMKYRINKFVGEGSNGVTACTFHSFCAQFLRKHAHVIGISNNYSIIDGQDVGEAISIVREKFMSEKRKLGLYYKVDFADFPNKKKIASIYSLSINDCIPLSQAVSKFGYDMYAAEIKEIVQMYINYKRDRSLFDYDDLLLYTKKILERYEDIRKKTGEKYKYVCCDEYQDTNVIQDKILSLLVHDHNNLTVVGDDNQSIYSFRGAKIENILSFEDRYENCKRVVLHENYRSSQEILDAANNIMAYAKEGIRKELHAQFYADLPELIITKNDAEENEKLLELIKAHHTSGGTSFRDMAVIIRNSAQSYGLETLLNKNNIPFNKFGGLKFLEKSVIKDILSFLRLLVNDKDELALHRILKLFPGIGNGYSNRITESVMSGGLNSLNEICSRNYFSTHLIDLYKNINILSKIDIQSQLKHIIETYYPKIATNSIDASKVSDNDKLEMKKKLKEDLDEAKALYKMAEDYKLTKDFLEDLSLDSTSNKNNEDKLNITTIHSAKGLEYDVVFIMDCIEEITPRCDLGSKEENEELRCFYVAITRAKNKLYLFAPSAHHTQPYVVFDGTLSRFIDKDDILNKFAYNVSREELSRLRGYNNFWDVD